MPLPIEFSSELTINELPSRLRKYESKLINSYRQSSILISSLLGFSVLDAALVANKVPAASSLFISFVKQNTEDFPPKILSQLDTYGVFIIIGLFQLICLWVAWGNLYSSPWWAWMSRSLRKTTILSYIDILLSPSGFNQSKFIAGIQVFFQVTLWWMFSSWFSHLSPIISNITFFPNWLTGWGTTILAFIASWLVVSSFNNFSRAGTALFGILLDLGAIILASTYGQISAYHFFEDAASHNEIRWWSVVLLIFNILMLRNFSSRVLDLERVHSLIDKSNSLHISLPSFQSSVLPQIKFYVEAPDQNILILRRLGLSHYYFHDPKKFILPTEHDYEILNLSILSRQWRAKEIKIDFPEDDYQLRLAFRVNPFTPSSLQEEHRNRRLSYSSTQRIIEQFFRSDESLIENLKLEIDEEIKKWLDEDAFRINRLASHCHNLLISSTNATPLSTELRFNAQEQTNRIRNDIDFIAEGLQKGAGYEELARRNAYAKRKQLLLAQAQLVVIEEQLIEYKKKLIKARNDLQRNFKDCLYRAITRSDLEETKTRHRESIDFFIKIINPELKAVHYEEGKRIKDLELRVNNLKDQFISLNRIDAPLEAALRNRDSKIFELLLKLAEEQTPLHVVISEGYFDKLFNSQGFIPHSLSDLESPSVDLPKQTEPLKLDTEDHIPDF